MRLLRIAGLSAATALALAPAAWGSELDVAVTPDNAALGTLHVVKGQMRDDAGAPLAGRRIALQVRPFPYSGDWRTVDHATTGAKGGYAISDVELDRNSDLRAVAFDGTTSGIARAFTYPAHRLAYKVIGKHRIRLTQTYRTPRKVRLTRRTLFYVGSGSATSAPVRARARTRRVRAGRFEAVAVVRLPPAFRGRFQYASCFAYSPGSGMGDPAKGCPKRYAF